jgi:phage shock protein PspC (stress-responsive transcriptional regulator)
VVGDGVGGALGSTVGGVDGSGAGETVRPKTPVAATATAESRTIAARIAGTVRDVVERDIWWIPSGSMSLGRAGIRARHHWNRSARGSRATEVVDVGTTFVQLPDRRLQALTNRGRRLYRIREGQEIAGVCNGLAEYSELRVDWVRTLFVLGTLVPAGWLGLVYIALALILPVYARPEPHP